MLASSPDEQNLRVTSAPGLQSPASPSRERCGTEIATVYMNDTNARRGILFLCVANSVRSQIAEGIANRLAPAEVEIYSAGSSPARISSYAVRVLAEIGIDASAQYSKPIESIPLERIKTVITLCAEEVCPTLPGQVERLHWPLTDPSGGGVLEADVIEAYRSVRDELWSRLSAFFGADESRPESS